MTLDTRTPAEIAYDSTRLSPLSNEEKRALGREADQLLAAHFSPDEAAWQAHAQQVSAALRAARAALAGQPIRYGDDGTPNHYDTGEWLNTWMYIKTPLARLPGGEVVHGEHDVTGEPMCVTLESAGWDLITDETGKILATHQDYDFELPLDVLLPLRSLLNSAVLNTLLDVARRWVDAPPVAGAAAYDTLPALARHEAHQPLYDI